MYKFQKIRFKSEKINISYDWLLVIESVDELNNYHNQSMKGKISLAWDNLLDVQNKKAHINNDLAKIINLKAAVSESEGTKDSIITLTEKALNDIYSAKYNALIDTGKIYVNNNGGFFSHNKYLEVLDELIIDEKNLIFPEYTEKDIRVKQWDGGKHYYAYVGDFRVERDGKNKWDSFNEAYKHAKSFIYRINKEQYKIKE